MSSPAKSLTDITNQAIHVLAREIGTADTLRFLGQFSTGTGNYTEDRLTSTVVASVPVAATPAMATAIPDPPPMIAAHRPTVSIITIRAVAIAQPIIAANAITVAPIAG